MFAANTEHILFTGYSQVAPPHDHLYFRWNRKTGLWGATQLTSGGRHVGKPQSLGTEPGALVTRVEATFDSARETYVMRFSPIAPTSNRSSSIWQALSRVKREPRILPGTFGESGVVEVRLWPMGFSGSTPANTLVLPLAPETPTQLSVTWLDAAP